MEVGEKIKNIVIISGSLRKASYNTKLAKYIQNQYSSLASIEVVVLMDLPFFSEDLESNLPKSVLDLIEKIKNADAVIFCTPEYNNTIPGVLKNALEWLSRDYSRPFIKNKPVAITGCSTGGFGTVRAQNDLMQLCLVLGFKVDASLRFPISNAQNVFDADGGIVNEDISSRLKTFVNGFLDSI
jgi:chromate reductase